MRRILVIVSLAAAACSTGNVKDKGDKQSSQKTPLRTTASVTLQQVQANQCPKRVRAQESYAKNDWRELVALGNACVKAQRWNHVNFFANILAIHHSELPWGPYFWSLSAESSQDMVRARWMIDLALKKDSGTGLLHYQKGRLLWVDGHHTEAVAEMQAAVLADGSLNDAHSFLGQIFFRDQEYEKATKHFYAILRSRPNDVIALSGLAESRLQSGDTNGAIEAIKRAVAAYPDRVEFAVREAHIFENVMGDKVRALQAYRSALSQIQARRIRGPLASKVEQKVNELEGALRQPSTVAEQKPKNQEVKR